MKTKYLCLLFVGCAMARGVISAEPYAITEKVAPIVFAAKLPQPPSIESIMADYDPTYLNIKNQDEFAAHALLAKQTPIIQDAVQRAKNTSEFSYVTFVELGQYDFNRNGFPLVAHDMSSAISLKYNNHYRIDSTANGPLDITFLAVPLEYAQTLADVLRQSRQCLVRVTGNIYDVEKTDFGDRKIYFCPTSLNVSLADGTLVCQKPNLPSSVYAASVPSSNYTESFLKAVASYGGRLYAVVYGHKTTSGFGEAFDSSDFRGTVLITASSSTVSFSVTDQEKEIRAGDFATVFYDGKNFRGIGTGSINYLGGVNYLRLPENGQVVKGVNQQPEQPAIAKQTEQSPQPSGQNQKAVAPPGNETSDIAPPPSRGSDFKDLAASVQDAQLFRASGRQYPFSYDQVWGAALQVLTEQKEKIVQSDKERGVLITEITRHTSLVFPFYDKYCVLVRKVSDNSVQVTCEVLMYYPDDSPGSAPNAITPEKGALSRDSHSQTYATTFLKNIDKHLQPKK